MATYKLIQDIEAEDKILGPLTLRQFIFGLVAAFFFYISFIVVSRGAPFLLIAFLPPGIFCAFFAFPFGRDQPTEIWFLAKLRFWFIPRKRIWNQSGVKELVTITVPKKVERVLTNGLSQNEVKSRLQALANTIDSRGWAIKNVNVYSQPVVVGGVADRLIDLSNLPQEVPEDDIMAADDIMDPLNNQVAQQMDAMVNQSAQAHRQRLVDELGAAPPPVTPPVDNGWFTGPIAVAPTNMAAAPIQQQPMRPGPQQHMTPAPMPFSAPTTSAAQSQDEAELSRQLKKHSNSQHEAYSHLRTMRPLGAPAPAAPLRMPINTSSTVTAHNDPAILALANNDDLNVSTLAREAKKAKDDEGQLGDEVVISLR